MDRDLRRLIYNISQFLITRFPFWEGISTALLLGEWGGRNRSHGIPDIAVYTHIGVCLLLGSLLSFNDRRKRESAMYFAIQMAIISVFSLLIWGDSSQMVRLKIFSRNLAVVGAFLHFHGGNRRYSLLGNLCIAACLISEAYLLYAWSSERSKLFRMLPSAFGDAGDPFTFILCILFCLCAFCFITEASMRPASKCALALWSLAFLIDVDYKYWTGDVELWTQFRIIGADLCFASTLAVNYAFA